MYDLVIRNGLIVDGSGNEPFIADLAVKDGKIAAMGEIPVNGQEEMDANGLVVTPGFIDIHTHYDAQATWDDCIEPLVWHGVTTAVLGNCGVGFAPARPEDRQTLINMMDSVEDIPAQVLTSAMTWQWQSYPEYLKVIDHLPRTLDLASMVPHLCLRTFVMGDRVAEDPTDEELDAMCDLVREAMAAGAVGLSMSRTVLHTTPDGEPLPGTFAGLKEITALAKALRECGRGVLEVSPASTTAPEPNSLQHEIDLLAQVSLSADCPVVFTFLQNNYEPTGYATALDSIAQHNVKGARLHPAVICRPVSLLMNFDSDLQPFASLPSFAPLKALPLADKIVALQDPALRQRLLTETNPNPSGLDMIFSDPGLWSQVFPLGNPVNYYPQAQDCLQSQAEKQGILPQALAYDLMLSEEGKNFIVYAVTNWAERNRQPLYRMLTFPEALVGLGDAGAHLTAVVDGSQPTTLLSEWVVRDQPHQLSLEFAIRKLTWDNARIFGLTDRGLLAIGKRADINLIDLPRLEVDVPTIVRDLPQGLPRLNQKAKGYVATIVAGRITQLEGKLTTERPGRLAVGVCS